MMHNEQKRTKNVNELSLGVRLSLSAGVISGLVYLVLVYGSQNISYKIASLFLLFILLSNVIAKSVLLYAKTFLYSFPAHEKH